MKVKPGGDKKCQYLNTGVINVGTKLNSWKEETVRSGMSAKSVEARICKSYFRVFPSGKAVRQMIPVQQEHVLLEYVLLECDDFDRKGFL